MKNRPLVIIITALILVFCGLIVAWQAALYTLDHMSFRQVTPTQMAAAMRNDEFWYSYRFNTLAFDGTVKSVDTQDGKTTLGFVTSDAYGASCEVTSSAGNFKVGGTYKFAVETYQAQRQPHGVLLHNCLSE